MVLKNNLMFLFIFIGCSFLKIEAKIILPELLTKQAVNNIRFLSQDGRYTYYQKRSGSLLFSTNYKVQEMIKGEIGTEYTLFATPARKKIAIIQNLNFHNFYSLRAKLNIFLANYGESSAREVGTGISPTLLLGDEWLSYYDPYTKILHFENTINSVLKFSIKLNNKINAYFIPKVAMSDDNTVYYTDLNEDGVVGILEFKRNTSKSELIFKAPSPMVRAEICINQEHLYIGIFGIHFSKNGSSISKVPLPLKDFSKRENLYSSDLNDLGHIICDLNNDNVMFIKNNSINGSHAYDVVSLNLINKKISPLTEQKTISNIVNMDGTLITQEKGKYFIVKGETDFKGMDSLKADSSPAPGEKLKAMENEINDE